jgi:HlyD family secretion protein
MGESTAGKKTETELFRKVALEKLASPEQLDQLLRVTGARGWLALVAVGALLAVAVVWSVLGRVPTTVSGSGILVNRANPMEVVAAHGGTLMDVKVQVGDEVSAGQVIADVAQPDLAEQLRCSRDELAELKDNQVVLDQRDKVARDLEMKAISQLRTAILEFIATAEKRRVTLQGVISKYRTLVARGAGNESEVLAVEQNLDLIDKEVAESRVRLKELVAREEQLEQSVRKDSLTRQLHINDVKRTIAGLEERLGRTGHVVSPFSGRVAEVRVSRRYTEIKTGTPILLLVPGDEQEDLMAMVYVPAAEGKRVAEGMRVEVCPSTVRREEHGYLVGEVIAVAELPTTEQAMLAHLSDAGLVQAFVKTSGIPLEVQVRLRPDSHTPSGYEWSSVQGPPTRLSRGTLCTASFVVKEQRPISLALPLIKDKLGLK